MTITEWAAVVVATCAVVTAVGGLVWWMLLVTDRLASVDRGLVDLKASMLREFAQHSAEHRRLWGMLENHEDRIRTVELSKRQG